MLNLPQLGLRIIAPCHQNDYAGDRSEIALECRSGAHRVLGVSANS